MKGVGTFKDRSGFLRPRESNLTLFRAGFLPKHTKQNTRTAGIYTKTSAMRTVKNKKN